MRETDQPCWCAALPALERVEPGASCLCPDCLAARLDAQRPVAGKPEGDDAR